MSNLKARQLVCATFANKSMQPAADRVGQQVANMGVFDDFKPYDETMLDSDFLSRFGSKIHNNVRGFGYWCWKPQIALQTLAQMSEGDVLVYVDAGCHLNAGGLQRLDEYVQKLTPDAPILAFKYNNASQDEAIRTRYIPDWSNRDWTKEDLFIAKKYPAEHQSPHPL